MSIITIIYIYLIYRLQRVKMDVRVLGCVCWVVVKYTTMYIFIKRQLFSIYSISTVYTRIVRNTWRVCLSVFECAFSSIICFYIFLYRVDSNTFERGEGESVFGGEVGSECPHFGNNPIINWSNLCSEKLKRDRLHRRRRHTCETIDFVAFAVLCIPCRLVCSSIWVFCYSCCWPPRGTILQKCAVDR